MTRRQAREFAMQILFEIQLGNGDVEAVLERNRREKKLKETDTSFLQQLVHGVLDNISTLDDIIARLSREWDVKRLALVDKTLLRICLFEMLYLPDIPYNVSINEAIELAKVYSGDDSPKFINGILGKVVETPSLYIPHASSPSTETNDTTGGPG
ncbi:MAG: transcription antitermination factor NusB [Firmicutes bacterium]|nr:transcription antitermination factor NusB [Bacillota bacterium]